jgi:hypothetical protein
MDRLLEERQMEGTDRKHFAVGSAIEHAMAHLWADEETQWFLNEAKKYAHKSAVGAEGTPEETTRTRMIHFGFVGCQLIIRGEIQPSILDFVVRKFLLGQQRQCALDVLAESETWAYEVSRELCSELPVSTIPEPKAT